MRDKLSSLKLIASHRINDVLCFRTLDAEDVGNNYVDWMNDWQVTRHTEQRFVKTTRCDIISYLKKVAQSSSDLMFGIYENFEHIGIIKLGNINCRHLTADSLYLVGLKNIGKTVLQAV